MDNSIGLKKALINKGKELSMKGFGELLGEISETFLTTEQQNVFIGMKNLSRFSIAKKLQEFISNSEDVEESDVIDIINQTNAEKKNSTSQTPLETHGTKTMKQ